MKILLAALLIMFPLYSSANNKDYEYCIIWGVAGGANDSFTQSLAQAVLEKKRISYEDKVCSTLKQKAYKQGRQFSQGDTTDTEVYESWMLFQNFRNKVMIKLVEQLKL